MRDTPWSCAFRCLFCRARPVNSLVRGWNGDQALEREPVQRSTWQRSIHAKERMWLCILVGKIHCLRGWMRALYQTSKHRPSRWEQHPLRISLSARKFNKYSLRNNHVGAIVKRFHQISYIRDFFLVSVHFFSVHHYMPKGSDGAAKLCWWGHRLRNYLKWEPRSHTHFHVLKVSSTNCHEDTSLLLRLGGIKAKCPTTQSTQKPANFARGILH